MYWDMYDERIKGFDYAREPHRLRVIASDLVALEGHHSWHFLELADGCGWVCDCHTYWKNCEIPYGGWCRHTIAVERILSVQAVEACVPALVCEPI